MKFYGTKVRNYFHISKYISYILYHLSLVYVEINKLCFKMDTYVIKYLIVDMAKGEVGIHRKDKRIVKYFYRS